MKKLFHSFYYMAILLLSIFFLPGCNNGPADSVKEAKKENKEMIDDQLRSSPDSMSVLPSKEDADFLVNVSTGGMFEVQLGQLAQTHSQNQRVKNFASMLIKDHGETGEKVRMLASSKSIKLPDSVSKRMQKEIKQLQQKKGDAFDEAYINMMTDDHRKDISDFEKEAKNGTHPAIKSFAINNLKILYQHLDSAINIQKLVSKNIPADPVVPPL
jgi:putative membrane protein